MKCPCCNGKGKLSNHEAALAYYENRDSQVGRVAAALLKHPKGLPIDRLIFAMYLDEEEPDDARRVLYVTLSRLRKHLEKNYNLTIPRNAKGVKSTVYKIGTFK